MITLGAMLSAFDVPEVRSLVGYDELEMDTYGDPGQKTILYAIISDMDKTYNFLPAIMFTQMFHVLCYKADKEMGGQLATPVQFILDEFRNIGRIPNFDILIATVRSHLISCIIILQTQSQLKDVYKDAAETIAGNCDSTVFLGGTEKTTLKDLQEVLGEETIDLFNDSRQYGQNETKGVNYSKTGRKLLDVAELSAMGRDKCIVRLAGVPPFYSDKFNTAGHPCYKHTADADPGNVFDFKKYRERLKRTKKQSAPNALKLYEGDEYRVVIPLQSSK